jgi:hypothetical protein
MTTRTDIILYTSWLNKNPKHRKARDTAMISFAFRTQFLLCVVYAVFIHTSASETMPPPFTRVLNLNTPPMSGELKYFILPYFTSRLKGGLAHSVIRQDEFVCFRIARRL